MQNASSGASGATGMRVVVVSQLPPPVHGSSVVTGHLVDSLHAHGVRVSLVDRRFSRQVSEVGRFSPKKVVAGIWLILRAARQATEDRDVAIVFGTTSWFSFLCDLIIIRLLSLRGQPVINYVHTVGYGQLASRSKLHYALVRATFRWCRSVVCLGPTLADELKRLIPTATVHVIHNPSPSQSARAQFSDEPTILFFSNLMPEKGADTFISFAQMLAQADSRARFRIVGRDASAGFTAKLRGSASALVRDGRLTFVGGVDGTEKWAELSGAQVLVFPSRYRLEAQPMAIVEAMSVGLPVVSTAVGGIPDVVVNDQTGQLVPDDASAITSAVAKLLHDQPRWDTLHAGALKRFASHHSLASFGEAWVRLLRDTARGDDRNPV